MYLVLEHAAATDKAHANSLRIAKGEAPAATAHRSSCDMFVVTTCRRGAELQFP